MGKLSKKQRDEKRFREQVEQREAEDRERKEARRSELKGGPVGVGSDPRAGQRPTPQTATRSEKQDDGREQDSGRKEERRKPEVKLQDHEWQQGESGITVRVVAGGLEGAYKFLNIDPRLELDKICEALYTKLRSLVRETHSFHSKEEAADVGVIHSTNRKFGTELSN
jgi:hypothetical protein